MSGVRRTEVRARCVIEDRVEVPVDNVTLNYGINEIPIATCGIGHGYRARDGQPSISAETRELLDSEAPAKIYGRFSGTSPTGEPWPDEEILLFDGKFDSGAMRRNRKAAGRQIIIRHWLNGLSSSSILASYAYPHSPYGLTGPAVTIGGALYAKNAAGGRPVGIAMPDMTGILQDTEDTFTRDIWGEGAKRFIAALTIQAPYTSTGESCLQGLGGNNEKVQQILKRIEGPLSDPFSGMSRKYTHGVPLQLTTTDFPAPQQIEAAARQGITAIPVESLSQLSTWQYLLGYCRSFGAMVVPCANYAVIAPRLTTNNEPARTFDATVTALSSSTPLSAPLKGVVMTTDRISYSGRYTSEGDLETRIADGYCYLTPHDSNGRVRHINPPAWLANIEGVVRSPDRKLDSDAPQGVYGASTADNGPTVDGQTYQDHLLSVEDYFHAATKLAYTELVLQGRTAKVATGLRTDVSPGMTVQVRPDENSIAIGNPIVGMVARVTITLNAQRPHTSTDYLLSHVRTPKENQLDVYGANRHPLYRQKHVGGPLAEPA